MTSLQRPDFSPRAPSWVGLGVLLLLAAAVVLYFRVPPHPVAEALPRDIPAEVLRTLHPAEVLRVYDGDTFEARVALWPGLAITTRVRLRDIDTPEMEARCDDERRKAEAARTALRALLNEGGVGLSNIGPDKYAGRVDATVSTRRTTDVSAALLAAGHGRPYHGGKRQSWC